MRILIIEDDKELAGILMEIFCGWDNECRVAETIEEGKKELIDFKPHVIVLDLLLKGELGAGLITEAKKQRNPPCVVLCSAMHGADKIAEEYKPDYFLKKPFDLDTIEEIIKKKNV